MDRKHVRFCLQVIDSFHQIANEEVGRVNVKWLINSHEMKDEDFMAIKGHLFKQLK